MFSPPPKIKISNYVYEGIQKKKKIDYIITRHLFISFNFMIMMIGIIMLSKSQEARKKNHVMIYEYTIF
jgi:hypothetical protein